VLPQTGTPLLAYDVLDVGSEESPSPEPRAVTVRPFVEADEDSVVDLWDRCGLLRPWNDPRKDIARKLRVQRELLLVGEIGGRLVAVVMAGYEGHRGWVNYLAVEPGLQGRGIGRRMMEAAEKGLAERGCPKVQIQIRRGNLGVVEFYRALGYAEDEVVSMGKRLEFDDEPPAV
jgi:ribosomal protein S18 acetylase RimI-like enzyme